MTFPDPADIPPAQHGGKREGSGRKKKPAATKAFSMSIVLSCENAALDLKAKAKIAGCTPGALIEKGLKLSTKPRPTR